MLSVKNLSKSFDGNTILRDISLDVAAGETTVILGPSGSGKSTLLRCLNLLETPELGQLSIEGDTVDFGSRHHLVEVSGRWQRLLRRVGVYLEWRGVDYDEVSRTARAFGGM